jgi:hypothetical protein
VNDDPPLTLLVGVWSESCVPQCPVDRELVDAEVSDTGERESGVSAHQVYRSVVRRHVGELTHGLTVPSGTFRDSA